MWNVKSCSNKKKFVEANAEVVQLAKGEAEMMSWNAEWKWNGEQQSPLGLLGLLTLFILLFSTGKFAVAEDFTLYRVGEDKALSHMTDQSEKDKAIKWLVTDQASGANAEMYKKHVETFKAEPFKMAEGIKFAIEKGIEGKDEAQIQSFVTQMKNGLMAVPADAFGKIKDASAETVFKYMFEQIFKIKPADLKGMSVSDFLKKIFDELVKAGLSLTEKPTARDDRDRRDSPDAKNDGKNAGKNDGKNDNGANNNNNNANNNGGNQPPTVPPYNGGVGEVFDPDLDRRAQAFCDKVAELEKQRRDDLNRLNELFNRVNALSRLGDNRNRRNDRNRLEDILPALLADALRQSQQQPQVTPPQQTPPIAARARNNDDQPKNPFSEPLPQKEDPQPRGGQMPPPPGYGTGTIPPFTLERPDAGSARAALREARDLFVRNENSNEVNRFAGANLQFIPLADLVLAKGRAESRLSRTRSVSAELSNQITRLEEEIERFKENSIPRNLREYRGRLQQQVEQAKRGYEQARQAAGANKDADPQEVGAALYAAAEQVGQAEATLAQFNERLEGELEERNQKVRSLTKLRDNLSREKSNLDGQIGEVTQDRDAIDAMVKQKYQMEYAAIVGANQPVGTVRNVNDRIQSFGNPGTGFPRTVPPQRVGIGSGLGGTTGLTSAQPGSTSGSDIRGPLRGVGAP